MMSHHSSQSHFHLISPHHPVRYRHGLNTPVPSILTNSQYVWKSRWERQLLEHIEDGRERLKFKLKSSQFLKTFHRHFSVSSIHFFIFTTSDSQVRTKMKRCFASKANFPHIHSGSNGKISWLALPFRKGCKQNVPHFHCASLCFSVEKCISSTLQMKASSPSNHYN